MPRFTMVVTFLAVFAAVPFVRAADAPDPRTADVQKAIAALEKKFNDGDAKALAACWTARGDFLGPRGERIEGRENIEKVFAEFLAAHKDNKLRMQPVSIRMLGNDAALIEAIPQLTPPLPDAPSEPLSTIILVRQDGRWLIESIRESHADLPEHSDRLKNLEWMVGDWASEAAQSSPVTMHSSCDWTASHSFLIRKFSADTKDGMIVAGTEVIGWDPRAKTIRSWTFDSDGSFGESIWTRDGDRWLIKHHGTAADGSDMAVTHVATCLDPNTLTLRSTDRIVNGEKKPDLPEIRVKRQVVKEAAKPAKAEPETPPKQVLP